MEQIILNFLKWIDHIQTTDPMRLETDNVDIMMAFIEDHPEYKSKLRCEWCGNNKTDRGKIITKTIHEGCHEAILNGEGII